MMNHAAVRLRPPLIRFRTAIAALVIGALAVLGEQPGIASAHAYLVRAIPGDGAIVSAAPRLVRLWFSEPIDLPPTALELSGPDGRPVPIASVSIASDDATEMVAMARLARRGTYVLRWKVISADTHPVWGGFTFSIGVRTPIVSPLDNASPLFRALALGTAAGARLLNLLSLAFLAGPLALWAIVLAPTARRHAPTSVLRLWQRTMRLYSWGLALLLVAAPLTLAAQMMSVSDTPAAAASLDAFVAALSGRLGEVLVVRLALCLALFVVGASITYLGPGRVLRSPDGAARLALHPALFVAGGLSATLALSLSLSGHAAVAAPVPLSLLLDVLHLVAMALWIGGLFALVGVLAPALRSVSVAQRDAVVAVVIARFSALALACVATLTLTGLYSSVLNLSGPLDLLATDYGRVLGLKLLVSVAILLVASVNLLALRPGLTRVARGHGRAADLWAPMRALLRAEALLAVGVLVVVGVLTSLPPARQPALIAPAHVAARGAPRTP